MQGKFRNNQSISSNQTHARLPVVGLRLVDDGRFQGFMEGGQLCLVEAVPILLMLWNSSLSASHTASKYAPYTPFRLPLHEYAEGHLYLPTVPACLLSPPDNNVAPASITSRPVRVVSTQSACCEHTDYQARLTEACGDWIAQDACLTIVSRTACEDRQSGTIHRHGLEAIERGCAGVGIREQGNGGLASMLFQHCATIYSYPNPPEMSIHRPHLPCHAPMTTTSNVSPTPSM